MPERNSFPRPDIRRQMCLLSDFDRVTIHSDSDARGKEYIFELRSIGENSVFTKHNEVISIIDRTAKGIAGAVLLHKYIQNMTSTLRKSENI